MITSGLPICVVVVIKPIPTHSIAYIHKKIKRASRSSSVDNAYGCRLDVQRILIRFPAGEKYSSLPHTVQTGSHVYTESSAMGNED
jgi:hypothetical protein